MKPSKFNILSRSGEEPHKVLLYNTLHDHRILFDDPELDPETLFKKAKGKEALTRKEKEALEELKELGILLDENVDEQKIFEAWYHTKIRERTDYMQVTILPTMGCNLACNYCFENGIRSVGLMKPETVAKLVAWLQRKVDRVRPGKLDIVFFGGEPLLHPTALETISKNLWNHCKGLSIPFQFGMVTNGVRLTPEIVDRLLPFGFRWIKITFDGDCEEHDKKRVTHGGAGTFDIIYNNLCRIKGKLVLHIGGNFDEENYASMHRLIERVRKSPFAGDIAGVRFKPIMPINTGLSSQREGKITSFCDTCSFSKKQVDEIVALQNKTLFEELPIIDRPEIGPCEFHQRHSFTIGPDGALYKCPGFAGLKNMSAGDLDHDDFNEQGERQILFKKWDEECESCAYLPNCAGGCRYSTLNKTGSLELKSCDIEFLKKGTEVFLQRELKALSLPSAT